MDSDDLLALAITVGLAIPLALLFTSLFHH
jgi:hypothetical protein